MIIKCLHNHLLNKLNWYNRYHQWEHHHKVHWAVLAVYILGVVSFGYTSFTQVPKASATDPEITTATLIAGVMPATSSDTEGAFATYDLGAMYHLSSFQISFVSTWPINSEIQVSSDNISYGATYIIGAPYNFPSPKSDSLDVNARYVRWVVTAGVSMGYVSLSDPHLYGTQLAPTVSITTPADNDTGDDPSDIYYTNTTPQTGSGTVTLAGGATIGNVVGNLSSSVTDSTSWTASGIALSPGSNTWTVTATDSNGYTGADSQTIFLDTTNPVISATTPSCSTTNSVAVTGTASDSQSNDSGLRTSNPITYTVDGGSTQNASGSTSWTATASSLTEGDHTVAITATDKATNTASTSKTVQYDPTAPSITVTSSSTSSTASYTLTGTASDATSGVASVNAGTGTTGTTSWSRTVTLTEGSNVFSITATDNCGNTSSATSFTVTYSATPPPPPPPPPDDDCTWDSNTNNCADYFGTFTILAPNGGESYTVGSGDGEVTTAPITWTYVSGAETADHVRLYYSTDGGVTYPNTITASTPVSPASYTWTLPTDVNASTVKVKGVIEDSSNRQSNAQDASDADFTITQATVDHDHCDLTAPTVADCGRDIWGTFQITAPNGGECYLTGAGFIIPTCLPTTVASTTTITWEYTLGTVSADHVKLAYSTDNGTTWYSITENTPLTPSSFTWTLPSGLSSTQMIIGGTITDSTGADIISDSSDAPFTLHANRAPEIRIK